MAYNNLFPTNYQQYYNYPTPPQNVQNGANSGIIWVQGEAGAKSYLVAPNNTVCLWDSENKTIYVKTADATGMPSMKVLDYSIREGEQKTADYVTKDEFDNIKKEFNELRSKFDAYKKNNFSQKGKVIRDEQSAF